MEKALDPAWFDSEALLQASVVTAGHGRSRITLLIEGMRCGGCGRTVERLVRNLPGVATFDVNFANGRASLIWDRRRTPLSAIIQAIRGGGFDAMPATPNQRVQAMRREYRASLRRIGVAALGGMQVVMLSAGAYFSNQPMAPEMSQFLHVLAAVLAGLVLAVAGRPFFAGAWRDLRNGRLGMDVPVALASGGAYLASLINVLRGSGGVYFDSAVMFLLFLSVGRFLELRLRLRSTDQVATLLDGVPEVAHLVTAHGERNVPPQVLEPGDRVRVLPGESLPGDGRLEQPALLDEALLTGEPVGVARNPGEVALAGSVNGGDAFVMTLVHTGANTRLSTVQRLAEQAQNWRPTIARVADRVASYFVAGVLLLVALAVWWWRQTPEQAFNAALATLVISCPCALSLATPAVLVAAGSRLARAGFLVISADALERLYRLCHLVFDKTGTLTRGAARVTRTRVLGGYDGPHCLALAAFMEGRANHPLAAAIRRAAAPDQLAAVEALLDSDGGGMQVKQVPGEGLELVVRQSHPRLAAGCYRLGRRAFAGIAPQQSTGGQAQGDSTEVYLARDGEPLAVFVIDDDLRPEAASTVAHLRQAGVVPHLFSGDRQAAVAGMARRLGIADARGDLSPEGKLQQLQSVRGKGQVVGMVGDGINDAAVLAGADLSIAMGGGADLAKVGADAVLLNDDLAGLPVALHTSRQMMRVIRQNLSWAVGYNCLAIPAAMAGWVPPWLAALGMSISSLVVVANAQRVASGDRQKGRALKSPMVGVAAR